MKQEIKSAIHLSDAILQLEGRKTDEEKMLKEQFLLAYNSIKPINLIKSTIKEAGSSPDLRTNILNTGVGLAAGYLTKKLFIGISNNPLKKIIGGVLMFGITNLVTKNPDVVKAFGQNLLRIITSRSGDKVHTTAKRKRK